jgi:chromosome segregation ATPase
MTDKIQRTLDLLYLISSTLSSSPQLSRVIEPAQITSAIEDLSSFAPEQEDEYLALDAQQSRRDKSQEAILIKQIEFLKQDNSELQKQVRDLADEVSTLREVNANREQVFATRLDTLQQELHILRNERSKLYDAAAGIEEAVHAKVEVESENEELKRINKQVSAENERLRKTNNALTRQLFDQEGERRVSLAEPSSPATELVNDILAGRREEDYDGMLRVLAKLQKEFDQYRLQSEHERESLHARMKSLQSVDQGSLLQTSPTSSPSRTAVGQSDYARGIVPSMGASVTNLFQAATSRLRR